LSSTLKPKLNTELEIMANRFSYINKLQDAKDLVGEVVHQLKVRENSLNIDAGLNL